MRLAHAILTLGGAVGLTLAPFAGAAQTLVVPGCGGVTHLLIIPNDPAAPRQDDRNCIKACHIAPDRRVKTLGEKRTCC